MKMSRNQFKALVKEALVELLSEGLGNINSAPQVSSPSQHANISGMAETAQRRQPTRPSPLDQPIGPGRQMTSALREAVQRESGGNTMMADILADTAVRTLPGMLANDRPGQSSAPLAGRIEQIVDAATPEQLFGEDMTSRWANLAFMDNPPKKLA